MGYRLFVFAIVLPVQPHRWRQFDGFLLPASLGPGYGADVLKSRFSSLTIAGVLLLGGASGCQNYQDQLQRGQGYYEQNQYESALSVWRHLEPDQAQLSSGDVVRYCYLRGMTDFRLGYRDHARYWLGLAQAGGHEKESALLDDEKARLEETLQDLNQDIFGPEFHTDVLLKEQAIAAAEAAEQSELEEKLQVSSKSSAPTLSFGSPGVSASTLKCQSSLECVGTLTCSDGHCVEPVERSKVIPAAEPTSPAVDSTAPPATAPPATAPPVNDPTKKVE